jgi:hypothetical protein
MLAVARALPADAAALARARAPRASHPAGTALLAAVTSASRRRRGPATRGARNAHRVITSSAASARQGGAQCRRRAPASIRRAARPCRPRGGGPHPSHEPRRPRPTR